MMATPTYDLIEEQVLGSAQATVTFGSGGTLTQAYKDLVLECISTQASDGAAFLRVGNGTVDVGSNYSETELIGNGSTGTSTRRTSNSAILVYDGTSLGTSSAWNYTFQLMSYTNASVYKSMLTRQGNAALAAFATVGLWRSTSAITIASFISTGTFATGSTFRLWGVKG